jgi:site-specific recombinase XerD
MNAYLALRNLNANGEYSIYAEYSNSKRIKRIPTGLKVKASHWDQKNGLIKQNGQNGADVKKANTHIRAVLASLDETIDKLYLANGNILPTIDQLNAHVTQKAESLAAAATQETTLLAAYSDYVVNRTRWSEATRTNHKAVLRDIADYQKAKKVTWLLSTISNKEIDNFQSWLVKAKGLANSTLIKKVRLLKHFFSTQPTPTIKAKINYLHEQHLDYPVVLEKSEIEAIEALELAPDSRLGKVRNRYILQLFTGLRYGDLNKLESHHIKGNEIVIREGKTNKTRAIPIFPQAAKIIALYTNAQTNKLELPVISPQKFNKYLSELVASLDCLQHPILITERVKDEMVERWEAKHLHIKSHSARRTFCSLLLAMGYSIRETMTLSGHRSISAFQRYMGKAETNANAVTDFANRWNSI